MQSIRARCFAYNCSPSFNWKKNLDDATVATFPAGARRDGLQVPVHHARGFHSLNYSMFNLAHGYAHSR